MGLRVSLSFSFSLISLNFLNYRCFVFLILSWKRYIGVKFTILYYYNCNYIF